MPEPLVTQRPKGESFRPVEPARAFREVSIAKSFENYRPSFDELFDRFWCNFEDVGRPKSEKLESLTVEVLLSPDEAAYGGQVRVWIPARAVCRACGGRGSVGMYECWRCEGHGALTTEFPLDLDYPARLRDGHGVRIPLTRFGIENLYLTGRLPALSLYPVTLPVQEAGQAIKATLAYLAAAKRKIFPLLPAIDAQLKEFVLVYMPFDLQGVDWVQPQIHLSINRTSLNLGRKL